MRRSVTKTVTEKTRADSTPSNAPIRQDLIAMCDTHPRLVERGISEETCAALGIGYLAHGRSPLKGRIVFQVADARETHKSDGQKVRVILSHVGRATTEDADAKYLFYPGFHKSAELYGQEIPWLHEDAFEQIQETGFIVLPEGPFDVAKAAKGPVHIPPEIQDLADISTQQIVWLRQQQLL